jgi:hypothetical protein
MIGMYLPEVVRLNCTPGIIFRRSLSCVALRDSIASRSTNTPMPSSPSQYRRSRNPSSIVPVIAGCRAASTTIGSSGIGPPWDLDFERGGLDRTNRDRRGHDRTVPETLDPEDDLTGTDGASGKRARRVRRADGIAVVPRREHQGCRHRPPTGGFDDPAADGLGKEPGGRAALPSETNTNSTIRPFNAALVPGTNQTSVAACSGASVCLLRTTTFYRLSSYILHNASQVPPATKLNDAT